MQTRISVYKLYTKSKGTIHSDSSSCCLLLQNQTSTSQLAPSALGRAGSRSPSSGVTQSSNTGHLLGPAASRDRRREETTHSDDLFLHVLFFLHKYKVTYTHICTNIIYSRTRTHTQPITWHERSWCAHFLPQREQ